MDNDILAKYACKAAILNCCLQSLCCEGEGEQKTGDMRYILTRWHNPDSTNALETVTASLHLSVLKQILSGLNLSLAVVWLGAPKSPDGAEVVGDLARCLQNEETYPGAHGISGLVSVCCCGVASVVVSRGVVCISKRV